MQYTTVVSARVKLLPEVESSPILLVQIVAPCALINLECQMQGQVSICEHSYLQDKTVCDNPRS